MLAAARVECAAMLVSNIKFVDYPFDLQKTAIDRHQICREIIAGRHRMEAVSDND
jgi:hypothetical protein